MVKSQCSEEMLLFFTFNSNNCTLMSSWLQDFCKSSSLFIFNSLIRSQPLAVHVSYLRLDFCVCTQDLLDLKFFFILIGKS